MFTHGHPLRCCHKKPGFAVALRGSGLCALPEDRHMQAGHSGKTGRFKSLEDDALYYSFFLRLEGINE